MSSQGKRHAARAIALSYSLGFRAAAGYLRNRNVCLEEALRILTGAR